MYSIAIVFGIVQGLTEFIPVSSSGHLLLLHAVFPSLAVDTLTFDVALHVGTLLALLLFFWSDVVRYLTAWFQSFGSLSQVSAGSSLSDDQRLSWLLLLGIIPAGVAGFLFDDIIEQALRSPWIVVVTLFTVAILFIMVELWQRRQVTIEVSGLRWQSALLIGCAQVLALIPGVSRSGITIMAGMFTRLTRPAAARFSFLLAIPLVAAAGAKQLIELMLSGTTVEWGVFIVGGLAAAISGYAVIRFLMRWFSHHTLIPFAIYRICLAVVVTIILLVQ